MALKPMDQYGKVAQQLRKILKEDPETKSKSQFVQSLREMVCHPAMYAISKDCTEIRELCIRDIVRKQAEEFYERFPIPELKERLIELFIEMEACRREDDFGGYCHEAHNQVSRVVEHLCEAMVERYEKEKQSDFMLYSAPKRPTIQSYILYSKYDKFKGEKLTKYDFHEKAKVVLYYFLHSEMKKVVDDETEERQPVTRQWEIQATFRILARKLFELNRQRGKDAHGNKLDTAPHYMKIAGVLDEFMTLICDNYDSVMRTP